MMLCWAVPAASAEWSVNPAGNLHYTDASRTVSWIRSVAELQEWEKARRTWRGRLKGGHDQHEIAGHEPVK